MAITTSVSRSRPSYRRSRGCTRASTQGGRRHTRSMILAAVLGASSRRLIRPRPANNSLRYCTGCKYEGMRVSNFYSTQKKKTFRAGRSRVLRPRFYDRQPRLKFIILAKIARASLGSQVDDSYKNVLLREFLLLVTATRILSSGPKTENHCPPVTGTKHFELE